MTTITGMFKEVGPVFPIKIQPVTATNRMVIVFRGIALIDTGSAVSAISEEVAKNLGLSPVGETEGLATDSIKVRAKEYRVNMFLGTECRTYKH